MIEVSRLEDLNAPELFLVSDGLLGSHCDANCQVMQIRHNLDRDEPHPIKTVVWIGSSRSALKSFPAAVKM